METPMESQPTVAEVVSSTSDDVKNRCQQAWRAYLNSIQQQTPHIILPKAFGDELGDEGLRAVAYRMMRMIEDDIEINYDPRMDVLQIGPVTELFTDRTLHLINIYYYQDYINFKAPIADPGTLLRPKLSPQEASIEKADKIPKPPNCFILYRRDKQPIVQAENPGAINIEISKIIGAMWKNESPEVIEAYKIRAEEEKQKLLLAHPGWKCSPRKPSEIKKRSTAKGVQLSDPEIAVPSADVSMDNHLTYDAASQSITDVPEKFQGIYGPKSHSNRVYRPSTNSRRPSWGDQLSESAASSHAEGALSLSSQDTGMQDYGNPYSESFASTLPWLDENMFVPRNW